MTRALGQAELLVAPRPKRVVVSDGACAWWGIDPSTLRVAIATVSSEGRRGVSTRSFPSRTGGRRLAVIHYETQLLARSLVEAGEAPAVIVVEQPSGQTPNLQLVYAVGVILAAVAAVVPRAVVETVPSSTWKRVACGKGNLYKPKRQRGRPAPAFEEYGVARWAAALGYLGSSYDEVDAMGVCDYAFRTYGLERL